MRIEFNNGGESALIEWPDGAPVPQVGDSIDLDGWEDPDERVKDWDAFMGSVRTRVFFAPDHVRLVIS